MLGFWDYDLAGQSDGSKGEQYWCYKIECVGGLDRQVLGSRCVLGWQGNRDARSRIIGQIGVCPGLGTVYERHGCYIGTARRGEQARRFSVDHRIAAGLL